MGKVKSEMFKEELGFDDCLQLLDSLTVYETPEKIAKRYLENDLPPVNTIERFEALQKLMDAVQRQKLGQG
jgi:hypothetical protein